MIETYLSPTKTEAQRQGVQGWCDDATIFMDPDFFLLLCFLSKMGLFAHAPSTWLQVREGRWSVWQEVREEYNPFYGHNVGHN